MPTILADAARLFGLQCPRTRLRANLRHVPRAVQERDGRPPAASRTAAATAADTFALNTDGMM
jgi:hypothetical protein